MRRLYSAGSLTEAYLVLHQLTHAGVAARVLNEHAQGGLGDIPFTHVCPEIWIDDERDFERARALVTKFESARSPGPPRRCGSCGEENPSTFEICWNCSAPIEK